MVNAILNQAKRRSVSTDQLNPQDSQLVESLEGEFSPTPAEKDPPTLIPSLGRPGLILHSSIPSLMCTRFTNGTVRGNISGLTIRYDRSAFLSVPPDSVLKHHFPNTTLYFYNTKYHKSFHKKSQTNSKRFRVILFLLERKPKYRNSKSFGGILPQECAETHRRNQQLKQLQDIYIAVF